MDHHVVLRILYGVLFLYICLLGIVISAGHWITSHFGAWAIWGAFAVYGAGAAGLIWLINRVGDAFPTLDFPPDDTPPWSKGRIRQTSFYVDPGASTAEKSPPFYRPFEDEADKP